MRQVKFGLHLDVTLDFEIVCFSVVELVRRTGFSATVDLRGQELRMAKFCEVKI